MYSAVDAVLLGWALALFSPESALPWGDVLVRVPIGALLSAVVAAPLLQVFTRLDGEGERDGALTHLVAS